jgi:hypothetical protein
MLIRSYQVDMADPKRLSKFVERYDGGIASTALEAAQVLLA